MNKLNLGSLILFVMLAGNVIAKENETSPSFNFSLGAGAAYLPKFSGADEYEVKAIPMIQLDYGNFTFGGAGGISYRFINNKDYTAGATIGYFQGRNASDASYLYRLGSIDSGVNLGLFGRKYYGNFALSLYLKRDFSSDSGGVTAGLSGSYNYWVTPQFMLNTSVLVIGMSKRHAQALYGITEEQSQVSDLSMTKVQGGIESTSLSFAGMYFINKQWRVSTIVSVTQLMGDAESSPITRDSQPIMLMTSVSYQF